MIKYLLALILAVQVSYAGVAETVKFTSFTGKTSTFNANSIQTRNVVYAVQCTWTEEVATLAGTIQVQASNDNTTFVNISGTSQTMSGTDTFIWNFTSAGYSWVRPAVTALTGGTMGLDCILVSKK